MITQPEEPVFLCIRTKEPWGTWFPVGQNVRTPVPCQNMKNPLLSFPVAPRSEREHPFSPGSTWLHVRMWGTWLSVGQNLRNPVQNGSEPEVPCSCGSEPKEPCSCGSEPEEPGSGGSEPEEPSSRGSESEEPGSPAPKSELKEINTREPGGFHWICSWPPIHTGFPLVCECVCVPSLLFFTPVLWVCLCSFTPLLWVCVCVLSLLCCEFMCVPSPLCCECMCCLHFRVLVCLCGWKLSVRAQLYSYSPSRTLPALALCFYTLYIILPEHILAMQCTASLHHHLLMQHCLIAPCYMV